MSGGQHFPKSFRLREKKEIDRVFREGRYHRLGLLQAKSLRSALPHARFMVSVRKSIGNAPQRNRIKRVVREAIRLNRVRLSVPHDVCIFMTNRPKAPVALPILEEEVRSLFERLSGPQQAGKRDG